MIPLLRLPGFAAFLLAAILSRCADAGLVILLGVSIWQATHSALALGWLGLAEAIPAIMLVLYGGHVADRHNRRRLVIAARSALAVLVAALAMGAAAHAETLYGIAFLIGCTRAFADPASAGLEAQVIPAGQAVRAVSMVGAVGRFVALGSPVLLGGLYEWAGSAVAYGVIAAMLAGSAGAVLLGVPPRPTPPSTGGGTVARIMEGVRFVFASQILAGSMALDLFAVFFGGAAGLFPIFATDILDIGPAGVGLLRSAVSAGALLAMAITTRHPPRARAGLALHVAVAGFGIGIIVFGLSRNLALSLAALFIVGACDGISMVVRQSILRLAAPEAMRGRVAAVRSVFLNSSNELGDFESGMLAHAVGPAAAVWLGGCATLTVVALTAWRATALRRLDLRALERG